MNVLFVVHAVIGSNVGLPSYSSHLYCAGVEPPCAMAVNVMGVPTVWGATLFAARVTLCTAIGGGAMIANGVETDASGSSLVLPLPRAHAATRYWAFAVDGVHVNESDADHPVTGAQPLPASTAPSGTGETSGGGRTLIDIHVHGAGVLTQDAFLEVLKDAFGRDEVLFDRNSRQALEARG